MKKFLFSIILLASCAFSQELQRGVIGPFGGLDNSENSLVIPSNKAQDLLNVDIQTEGKSVKKREGTSLALTMTITTSPVHGTHSFFNSNLNDVVLVFNDKNVTASVSGGSPSVIYTSGTTGATWQCVDTQGNAYCANSSRDGLFEIDGVTVSTLPITSTGTMVALTTERLVQAGFSAVPNRIDFSKSNDFETWTVGGEPSDPITWTITAPGPKITHIVYAHERIYWFKNRSCGYIIEGETHDDWTVRSLSNEIGTEDNTSVEDENGNIYFRGQDGHIYLIDGANLIKISDPISGTVMGAQSRISNSWTQTSESDFEAGSFTPSGWEDTDTTSGDLTHQASYYLLDSASEWTEGSFSSNFLIDTHTYTGSLALTFPDLFNSFRDGTSGTKQVWEKHYHVSGYPSFSVSGGSLTITPSGSVVGGMKSISPFQSFSSGATYYLKFTAPSNPSLVFSMCITASDLADGSSCRNESDRIDLQITDSGSNQLRYDISTVDGIVATIDNSPRPGEISLFVSPTIVSIYDGSTSSASAVSISAYLPYLYFHARNSVSTSLDEFSVSPVTATWNTSNTNGEQFTNLGISDYYWDVIASSFTDSASSIVFESSASPTEISPSVWVSVSTGQVPSLDQDQYLYNRISFNYTDYDSHSPPIVGNLFYGAYSSGTYQSQVNNAPNITSWDTFGVDESDIGGSQAFYIRSATNSFTVDSSTPSWTAITPGNVPTISTGTYFQVRSDFAEAASSNTLTLHSFTVNWFEGTASDKSYGAYFDNRIYFSIASGEGQTTNNRVIIYDKLNLQWTLYDWGVNGFHKRNNALYFGGSGGGYVYKFGDANDDNGSAINAYWKSKDFFGNDPFVEKDYRNISVIADQVDNSSMTVTYSIDGQSGTAYTINLEDSGNEFIRHNKNLPQGKRGDTINIQFGNNAANQPFEVFGVQYGFTQKDWRPN